MSSLVAPSLELSCVKHAVFRYVMQHDARKAMGGYYMPRTTTPFPSLHTPLEEECLSPMDFEDDHFLSELAHTTGGRMFKPDGFGI
ncbi:hypothetical protein AVEN_127437-1 [Araneus ventricosus]|uniref:Uncharacterized protein n=1 Tax=Araneus ventricosus TaxID=182803 RepID=A0A4Y2EXC5_ARAVE|nr:hypothetical protein AVEN_127437-1 [Araneus ventricosus]